MIIRSILLTLFYLVWTVPTSRASLMPGIVPNDFESGDALNVFANKMVSRRTRLPYDYFSLPLCKPSQTRLDSLKRSKDSGRLGIGQILQGERARLTAYDFTVLKNIKCAQLCTADFTSKDIVLLRKRIAKKYRVRLSLDDLPVVQRDTHGSYKLGYPLGLPHLEKDQMVVNHLDFIVRYHIPDEYESLDVSMTYIRNKKPLFRIVGFEVVPKSIAPGKCEDASKGMKVDSFLIPHTKKSEKAAGMQIQFTYSVEFVKSEVRWSTRFDTLLKISSGRKKMQVFAITNSLMLAVFLTASLAAVLFRTLRRDCARYGIETGGLMEDFHEDFDHDIGWRMLRGDVFRAPAGGAMLCVLCGSGAQLVVVTFVTLVFALLGIVNPHRRGNLISGLLSIWVLSSGVGGYVAARLHKAMGGVRWKLVTLGVSLVLPGIAFGTFFVVNMFLWMMGSTGAAPFLTMAILLIGWLGVSVPLAFAGTYVGYRRKAYDLPVRTNQIPRPIPRQPAYISGPVMHLLAGMLPFGVVCIELRVIFNSIYMDEFYHFFGFLIAVLTILAITCAETSVVVVFIKLSNCDYLWWWNGWLASATSGVYVFAYSLYYLMTTPGTDASNIVSNFMFLTYSMLGSLCFSLLTGTIGFLSSLAFVRKIYSASAED